MDYNKIYKLAEQGEWDEWHEFLTCLSTASAEEIKYKRWDGSTVLHVLCQINAPPYVVKAVIDAGADVNANDNEASRGTPLCNACCHKASTDLVQVLLEYGADPNLSNKYGMTPLYMACNYGASPDLVMKLLQGGANPDATFKGRKPIEDARALGYQDLVSVLSNWPPVKSAKFLS
jgi:ankyrin repeat protein